MKPKLLSYSKILLLVFCFTFGRFASAQTVIKQLYLSDPSQSLDRIDPVATGDATTASSVNISTTPTGVIVDASTNDFSKNWGSTIFTVSHTVGTGLNRLMLVGISQKNKLITSVTYGGLPLNLVGESITNGNARMHIYSLVNPPSGTANVVVNLDANPDKGIVVGVTSFTGVHQLTPLGTFAGATSKNTLATITVSSAPGELVYDVVSVRNTTMTEEVGQTTQYNINTLGEMKGGASSKPGAASVTMSWNCGGSQDWAIGAVSIKPAAAITSTSFTQAPALCSGLTIKAGTAITITNYVSIVSGIMPTNPAITAVLKYGAINIISISNPVYNSGTRIVTWTGTLGADITVPAGQAIVLTVTTAQSNLTFKIEFDSQTKPSKINLPVSTYINVNSIAVYSAAYPGGIPVNNSVGSSTKYIRAVVSDPFGSADITALNVTITPTGSTFAATTVATAGCTKTFEYVWNVPGTAGNYTINAIAKEGYENTVTHSKSTSINVCVSCPPSAVNDSAVGAGGTPLIIDVLANDSDPNNNINTGSLNVQVQPSNGSALISNGKLVYIPNGTFTGYDTLTYQICDLTALCTNAFVFIYISPTTADACSQAARAHTYFIPYPEQDAFTALLASSSQTMASNNIRSIISLKIPYPGVTITWDEWEDGYEADINNPVQSTTKVWGDGNIYNGIAPGYPTDIIPAGGSIVLDNTMPANPRVSSNIFYDGKDKIYSTGQIAMTQVCGEPGRMPVQAMKTNITSTYDFGQSFTIPFGQNFNSQDFAYTALFVRASQNNTTVSIDKDNNGSFETTVVLNQGGSYLVNGGVLTGATVTSDKPVGVEINSGGIDNYSIRNAPIFPATWYSNTYYTPVPTADVATDNPKDTSVVMLYNSLNRSITINWYSGVPANGTITVPAKSAVRFPLAYSATAAYKFVNPTGESFTAIEIVDSYTPGGGGNSGSTYDWSFNLISETRLSDYATIAWAPGSIDGTRNDNPVWVTPTANTTVYVKYDGNIFSGGSVSPCGLYYDVAYPLNALEYKKIYDMTDNDQGGLALFTCNGAKIAAVYGEDPTTALAGSPSWDVGSTIQSFCKQKMIFARDDYASTLLNQPVTISILNNDFGFLATIDPASVNLIGLLQPKNGTVRKNANGTVLYTPNTGFTGKDTFQYQVCSTPTPIVCDIALVVVTISSCPSPSNQNIISGRVFLDKNKDGINNDGGTGFFPAKVYLYTDGNCNTIADANEVIDSVSVDSSGTYQFIKYPEKWVADDFDGPGGTKTCANGTDGTVAWLTNWVDAGDPSTGFCVTPVQSAGNTDCEIILDGAFGYALRLDDNNVSASRSLNMSGALKAFLSFSYRRASATLTATEDVLVQMSTNGTAYTTIFTIAGNGTTDAAYVPVYNQDITAFASATTYIRFLTNNNVDEGDHVFIDDISIRFIKYNQCYITQLAPSSVPANHYLTTAAQRITTVTAGGTCISQFDFGIAKNSVGISGNVYNDNNGLTDNLVNGPAVWAPAGYPLYAYLVDAGGNVAFKSTVATTTGAFSFTQADVITNYTLMLSTVNVAQFAAKPSNAALPSSWVSTGDNYGVNNGAGSGNKAGVATASIAVAAGTTNVTGIKFGIERLPDSHDKQLFIDMPPINHVFTLNGGANPPVLSGVDGEDCASTCLLTGRSLIIDAYPSNSELYYNGILVDDGQLITNFNPSLFTLKILRETLDSIATTFFYSFVDAAGLKDPSPAFYQLIWGKVLPVKMSSFTANAQNCNAYLQWTTSQELNADKFVIESSENGIDFNYVATVKAANAVIGHSYQYTATQKAGLTYYRLKISDFTANYMYSPVITVQADCKDKYGFTMNVYPNPVKSILYLNLNTGYRGKASIVVTNAIGQKIQVNDIQVSNTASIVPIDMESKPSGLYFLYLNNEKGDRMGEVQKFVKE